MVDIKELMRTYVFLNDPDVKEVTTKFGALLLGITIVAAGVWAGVNYSSENPAGETDAPQAETSDASGGSGENGTKTDCVEDPDTWPQDNTEKLERLVDVYEEDGKTCYTYMKQ